MVTCSSCGHEWPDGFKFCGACGSPVAQEAAPEEERKVVTALFTDIVGSTASAEQLDPEDVRARLAPYYAAVRTELERFGGTVEKFIGDAVVALFGAPVAYEDDPERAVRAAIAIRNAVEKLNVEDEWLDLHIRTAVQTGEAVVVLGVPAAEGVGMAAGDVMNTAARLQGAAPVDGIVVGEATYRATEAGFVYREGSPQQAKGKAEPIRNWQLVGEKSAPTRPAAQTPLVGRTHELTSLSGMWERACVEGRPHLVAVVGPPGIGKTRLLVALCEHAESTGAVHWGRCVPYGEGITYWAVTEILKDAAGILQSDNPETTSAKLGALLDGLPTQNLDELRTMAAALANLIGVPKTPRGTYSAVEISQAELHWGIRRVLQLLASQRPLLLVFEDVHWAEPTLLELIRYLGESEEAPILLVVSARPELAEAHPEMLSESERRHAVQVDALDEDESEMLLAGLLGTEELAGGPLEPLLRNAAGNPLFLEETVRMLADTGMLEAGADLQDIPVPSSLQALIGSRLDGLQSPDKRVAQHASVVGHVFWSGAVAALQGSNGDLSESLDTLERRDFVHAHEESSIAGDREYAFKHILIRDVAYDRLPRRRRAELHIRFADWLAALPVAEDEYVEIEAHHLERACHLAVALAHRPIEPPILRAIEALKRSGQKAERREGIQEADRFYARALEIVGEEHPEAALELRLRRARTLEALGDLEPAKEWLTLVEEQAPALGRLDIRAAALVALASINKKQGRAAEARRCLEEADALASDIGDRPLEIRAAFEFAYFRGWFDGTPKESLDDLRRGLTIAEGIGDRALKIEGHLRTASLLFNIGELAEADEQLQLCLALANDAGSFRDSARATSILALVKHYRGDLDEAERLALQALEWLERTRETFFQLQNLRLLALLALAKDDARLAEERLRGALPIALELGGWLPVDMYRLLAEALVRQGRLAEARELAAFAGRSLPEEVLYARAAAHLAEATVATAEHRSSVAVVNFREALRLLEEAHQLTDLAETRLIFARALRALGELDTAEEELRRARDEFSRIGARVLLAEADGELLELGREAGVAGPPASV